MATVAMIGLGLPAFAEPPASDLAKIDNFTLTDQSGVAHELYSKFDAPVIVIATHINGDAISQETARTLESLKGLFGKAEYFLLNSSPVDTRATIAAEAAALKLDIPVLDDEQQRVARSLGASQTGEAFVIDPVGWKVLYHGPANAEAAKDPSEPFLLFNAVVYAMSHRPMDHPVVAVQGTPIAFSAD